MSLLVFHIAYSFGSHIERVHLHITDIYTQIEKKTIPFNPFIVYRLYCSTWNRPIDKRIWTWLQPRRRSALSKKRPMRPRTTLMFSLNFLRLPLWRLLSGQPRPQQHGKPMFDHPSVLRSELVYRILYVMQNFQLFQERKTNIILILVSQYFTAVKKILCEVG